MRNLRPKLAKGGEKIWKLFESYLLSSSCGCVADAAEARGVVGEARGLVGSVVGTVRCSWNPLEAVQLDNMRR